MTNKRYPYFVKYKRIPHLAEIPSILDNPIYVFEKLDGGNSQVRTYNGRILAGNRSNFLTDSFVHSKLHIPECRWFGDFLRWASKNYSFYNLPEDKIVFGEWLANHTLDYDEKNMNRFYVIDVFDLQTEKFIPYENASVLLNKLGIKDIRFLRPIYKGKVDYEKLERLVDKSDYRCGKAEGLVIKDYCSQEFSKLWEKTIHRKKRTLSSEDVKRTILTMVESDLMINRETVFNELRLDYDRQRLNYSDEELKKIVNKYFDDPKNLY